MKYKGKLIFLQAPPLDSIYKVAAKAKIQMYISDVIADTTSKGIRMAFNSAGYGYSIDFVQNLNNLYEGDIISEHKVCGNATLKLYSYADNLFCKIYFNDADDVYDCFLELEPYKPL